MLSDWRFGVTAAIFCTAVLLTCIETNAQSVPKEVASRIEIYAIPSVTISDQQFLTGDANGKQVTVAGEFRIAQGSGRLPVVVMMHGSGGVSGKHRGLGAPVQFDGHLDLRDRRLFRPRPDLRRHQPGAARPAQLHRRHLSRARDSRETSARRSRAHRADGIFARRTGGALCQPEPLPEALEQIRRRNSPAISRSIRTARRAMPPNRGRRPADPHLSRHARRL